MVNIDLPVESCESFEDREDVRTIGLGIPPDPTQKREVDTLGTPFGQVGARTAAIPQAALKHVPQARPAGDIEKDHRVGSVEASVPFGSRVSKEVAVEDPTIPGDRRIEVA
jgi:hypothetical protein